MTPLCKTTKSSVFGSCKNTVQQPTSTLQQAVSCGLLIGFQEAGWRLEVGGRCFEAHLESITNTLGFILKSPKIEELLVLGAK